LFNIQEKSMARIKRGMLIVSTLLLVTVITSACKTPYSEAPVETFTPIPQSNVFSANGTEPVNNIETLQAVTTNVAQQTTSPGAPVVATNTPDPLAVTPQAGAPTATNTPLVVVAPTNTATLAVSNPAVTPVPAGSRPASYTLQAGEFVYCIARRFNVNPDEILSLNGIFDSETIYPGLTLKIPQTNNTFPGNRTLKSHPATYSVTGASETVYSVACQFGDVDPGAIASANNISAGAALTPGQVLNIP
jgi:LysM repeat protein